MTDIEPGTYLHHKGERYEVIGTASHSETLAKFVVYKALYGDGDLHIRPLEMFIEDVVMDGVSVPRFRKIDNN